MKHSLLLEFYNSIQIDSYFNLVEELTNINKNDIDGELIRQSSIYSYYAGLLSKAKFDLDKDTYSLEAKSSELRKSEFLRCKSTGEKATDKYLDSYVFSHPDYISVTDKLALSSYRYNLLKSLITALDHKRDCLIQLSSNQRAETKLYGK